MINVQVFNGEVTVDLVRYAVLWVFEGNDVRYLRKRAIPDDEAARPTGKSQPVSQTGN